MRLADDIDTGTFDSWPPEAEAALQRVCDASFSRPSAIVSIIKAVRGRINPAEVVRHYDAEIKARGAKQ